MKTSKTRFLAIKSQNNGFFLFAAVVRVDARVPMTPSKQSKQQIELQLPSEEYLRRHGLRHVFSALIADGTVLS
jgi:hypothetical protein